MEGPVVSEECRGPHLPSRPCTEPVPQRRGLPALTHGPSFLGPSGFSCVCRARSPGPWQGPSPPTVTLHPLSVLLGSPGPETEGGEAADCPGLPILGTVLSKPDELTTLRQAGPSQGWLLFCPVGTELRAHSVVRGPQKCLYFK